MPVHFVFSMTTSHFHVTYNPVYTHVINLSFSVFNGEKDLKTEEEKRKSAFSTSLDPEIWHD